MASKVQPVLPSQEAVLTISNQLHLLAHRNKNQHRLAKWWSPFSMLRRHLSKIVNHLSAISALEPRIDLNWDDRKALKSTIMSKLVLEAAFIRDILGPKCYMAFSTVIADNQYAPIGLMLLGSLAQLHKLLASLAPNEEKTSEKDSQPHGSEIKILDADLGQRVSREEFIGEIQVPTTDTGVERKSAKKSKKRRADEDTPLSDDRRVVVNSLTPTPKEKKKKKKKKKHEGDAFDELFSGLV